MSDRRRAIRGRIEYFCTGGWLREFERGTFIHHRYLLFARSYTLTPYDTSGHSMQAKQTTGNNFVLEQLVLLITDYK